MTRDDLVKFLQSNYEPDEQLVWQTISYEDLENGLDSATPEKWVAFVREQEYYGTLAEKFSDNAYNKFYEFLERGEEATNE
jgi:hypothetical protein